MKIVILAGGISTERDVSLSSGCQIYKALKANGHSVILLDIFLGYEGDAAKAFENGRDWAAEIAPVKETAPDIAKLKASRKGDPRVLFGPNVLEICGQADIVFMALHGDSGENGKVQAALDLFGIKYTGTDALSSAIAMDKSVAKQLFVANGINTPKSILLKSKADIQPVKLPCVVKVCNGGSSIGVYIAKTEEEYKTALDNAFKYESKVLVEEFVKGREFTDGVIEGVALPIVQIEPKQGFYDYKNKYQAGSTIETCPAKIDKNLEEKIKAAAVKVFHTLGIKTYARIDFIVDDNGNIFCLEANTLPGMTPTSLVPQEAAVLGKSFPDLCEWIIEISLKKYK
ncbi:MAG: D-alanine--D-alanine ligase [Spirochaetaceae bacterium]|nr:D-alanine--D-alanine ligase [Spirochaetaceae bacterium]